jgi:hypothetical protein
MTTACKRNRVGNIDSARLAQRRYNLVVLLKQFSRTFENRIDFVMRAAELSAIEDEMIARGELSRGKRVTMGNRG